MKIVALRCADRSCRVRLRLGGPVTEAEKDRHAECSQTAEDPMLDCEAPDEPAFYGLDVRYDRAGRLLNWDGKFE